ncbi:MAG: redoxin domain-containing protein [Alphaproteobacteria bacterium]|nr:redoxin domain-containing protein [Alphaproteobacteria bacterium]
MRAASSLILLLACAPATPGNDDTAGDLVDSADTGAPGDDTSADDTSADDSGAGGDTGSGDSGPTGDSGPADTAGDSGAGDSGAGDSGAGDSGAGDSGTPAVPCAGRTIGTALGECAPDFTLKDASGVTHDLHSGAGQVTVLDFSTMWCPHCKALAPKLEALHQTHGGSGLRVITVLHEDLNGDPPDAADLNLWISTFSVTHLVLNDPQATVEAVFGGFYQPNVVVLDEDLVVRWRNTGSSSAQAVTAAVETVLAGGTP